MIIHNSTQINNQICEVGFDPLVNTYEISAQNAKQIKKYALQGIIAELLPTERVRTCMRYIVPTHNTVDGYYSGSKKRGRYSHLMLCGSIWSCPLCASRITETRRRELSDALLSWQGSVFMCAYTLQHDRGDSLKDLKNDLSKTLRSLSNDRDYLKLKDKFGIVGNISSLEVTWGQRAGWHPHKHYLYFADHTLTLEDITEIENVLSERYIKILSKQGRYSVSDVFQVQLGDAEQIKDYVCKGDKWTLAHEITKSPVKLGRDDHLSPFQLAAAYAIGNDQAGSLFREYYFDLKGSRHLVYSHGLRALLGLKKDKSDLELSKEKIENDDVLMFSLVREAWRVVCNKRVRGELLEVLSTGSQDLINDYLSGLGLHTQRFNTFETKPLQDNSSGFIESQ
jgi:hypothetical protein